MVDYKDSSQLNQWIFGSIEELEVCRNKANYDARVFLSERESISADEGAGPTAATVAAAAFPPVSHFACTERREILAAGENFAEKGPLQSMAGHPYLTPQEEAVLVSFYASKLPNLIGPAAEVPRLRRDSKVLATAAMLYRRFFLSNSVMLHDPKNIMVAAAFLAAKVEDATVDIRHVEKGTAAMNAPVLTPDIVQAEIALVSGIHFYLLCFHPYKSVLSLTEDLRTFFKTSAGKALIPQGISGQDLKPIYDSARSILEDVVVSDIPLLFSPGQIGLAALTVAQQQQQQRADNNTSTVNMDLLAYLKSRFPHERTEALQSTLENLIVMLQELKSGQHGCGKYHTNVDSLKAIHKKLKKVRAWGDEKKRNKKKRRDDHTQDDEKPAKRHKAE